MRPEKTTLEALAALVDDVTRVDADAVRYDEENDEVMVEYETSATDADEWFGDVGRIVTRWYYVTHTDDETPPWFDGVGLRFDADMPNLDDGGEWVGTVPGDKVASVCEREDAESGSRELLEYFKDEDDAPEE